MVSNYGWCQTRLFDISHFFSTFTLNADLQRRIHALELRSLRRLLGISYKDHMTNEVVRNRVAKIIGPFEDLLSIVKAKKLRWYGHDPTASQRQSCKVQYQAVENE